MKFVGIAMIIAGLSLFAFVATRLSVRDATLGTRAAPSLPSYQIQQNEVGRRFVDAVAYAKSEGIDVTRLDVGFKTNQGTLCYTFTSSNFGDERTYHLVHGKGGKFSSSDLLYSLECTGKSRILDMRSVDLR